MHCVIIGNGVAGVTAAMRIRELDDSARITLISGESDHHYSRPALMYVFMGHMRYQDTKPFEDHVWDERRIDRVRDWVVGIDTDRKRLTMHRGEPIDYDRLLIATGSKPALYDWPGQDLDGVQGLYGLQDLHALYRNVEGCEHAVVVGGGLIGIELGEMLHSRGIGVTFLVREKHYWNRVLPTEESLLIERQIRRHGMELRTDSELQRIEDDGRGRCCAVVTKDGQRIECQFVGLTTGVRPNLDLVEETSIPVGRGVLVDASLRTKVDSVFAAGDCAEIERDGDDNLLQQVWYTGKAQGRVAAESMLGRDASYDPGIWYNSAKFLDLEYQTYGRVNFGDEGEQHLYWEHDDGLKSLRLAHIDGRVTGINVFGIRYRHEVCAAWIRDERDVDYVLQHLSEGNFDPEFFARHEVEIVDALRRQFAEVTA